MSSRAGARALHHRRTRRRGSRRSPGSTPNSWMNSSALPSTLGGRGSERVGGADRRVEMLCGLAVDVGAALVGDGGALVAQQVEQRGGVAHPSAEVAARRCPRRRGASPTAWTRLRRGRPTGTRRGRRHVAIDDDLDGAVAEERARVEALDLRRLVSEAAAASRSPLMSIEHARPVGGDVERAGAGDRHAIGRLIDSAGWRARSSYRPLSTAAVRSAASARNWGVAAASTTVTSPPPPLLHAEAPRRAAETATRAMNGLRDTKVSLRACTMLGGSRWQPRGTAWFDEVRSADRPHRLSEFRRATARPGGGGEGRRSTGDAGRRHGSGARGTSRRRAPAVVARGHLRLGVLRRLLLDPQPVRVGGGLGLDGPRPRRST